VHLQPFSPQFIDPVLYQWNVSGDCSLHPVAGVTLHTRGSQCTDFLSIQKHIHLLEVTGSSHYRFALDWPRLFPKGDVLSVDAEAVRYYHCMLTELQKKGIRVAVTLYHPSIQSQTLGLPRMLHAQGGWVNTSTSDAFVDYATYCFQTFGPLVNVWITVNEPNRLTEAYNVSAKERDMVLRNVLMAHARAWKIYHEHFRQQQKAMISFALHADWAEPANPFVDSHTSTVQHFLFFELGRFLDPILQNIAYTDANSCHDCFQMPHFSKDERSELKGALDFIALNHFTTRLVYPKLKQDIKRSSFVHDYGCSFIADPTWASSNRGQAMVPWGLRKVLRWVKNRYGNTRPVIITATGIDDQSSYNDHLRQRYIKSYMQEALK
ncbi:beta-klotho, partial [Clarias magur]